MAKYTIISLILIDFVPVFVIFNLFQRIFRGSFRFKKIPSSKKSQVDFRGGGQPISIKSQVQKSPNPARGGGSSPLWTNSQVRCFFEWKASLSRSYHNNENQLVNIIRTTVNSIMSCWEEKFNWRSWNISY